MHSALKCRPAAGMHRAARKCCNVSACHDCYPLVILWVFARWKSASAERGGAIFSLRP